MLLIFCSLLANTSSFHSNSESELKLSNTYHQYLLHQSGQYCPKPAKYVTNNYKRNCSSRIQIYLAEVTTTQKHAAQMEYIRTVSTPIPCNLTMNGAVQSYNTDI